MFYTRFRVSWVWLQLQLVWLFRWCRQIYGPQWLLSHFRMDLSILMKICPLSQAKVFQSKVPPNRWFECSEFRRSYETLDGYLNYRLFVGRVHLPISGPSISAWPKLKPNGSFPTNSHGILFAIVELTSSLLNFSQIPVTNAVKLNQDFDVLTYILIGTSFFIVVRNVLKRISLQYLKQLESTRF